ATTPFPPTRRSSRRRRSTAPTGSRRRCSGTTSRRRSFTPKRARSRAIDCSAPSSGAKEGTVMEIYPAIDLLGGRGVRLHQGRYDAVTVYVDDPPAFAQTLRGAAARLHVVDLEGAREGRAVQRDVVRAVVAAFGPGVQVGGGVRSLEVAEEYFALG